MNELKQQAMSIEKSSSAISLRFATPFSSDVELNQFNYWSSTILKSIKLLVPNRTIVSCKSHYATDPMAYLYIVIYYNEMYLGETIEKDYKILTEAF